MKLDIGQVIANRYEIDELIGMGGMAMVYRAIDLRLDRHVTLKILREEFISDAEFIGRFDTEARAAASLSNPNIVGIYDVGKEGDINYIVFEYINGMTLKELINKNPPFDNQKIVGVTTQIANGLADAHLNKIIHRDIKPQNILVTSDGNVKITDFGIARAVKTGTLTGGEEVMGSVHYFSPEQARGGFIDHKSDIYSLGIVMYEMATSHLPFVGQTAVAVALKQINDPLPDISVLNPDISESIMRIIKKATEKSSSKRYQTVEEMAYDLKRSLSDPDGDFIDNNQNFENANTRNFTKEEQDEIKQLTRQANEFIEDEYDVEYEDEYDDEYDGYEDDYEDDYEDNYKYTPQDKKKERITIIAAISTALVFIGLMTWGFVSLYDRQTPNMVRTPDIYGMTLEAARQLANEHGLKVTVMGSEINDLDAGLIIEQAEPYNELLEAGDSIHVTLSLGPDKITIPDVTSVSTTIEDAREAFEGLDIELNEEIIDEDGYPIGVVVRQEPPALSEVPGGTAVTLFVSEGPDQSLVMVPYLMGKTEAEAIELIQEAELTAGHSLKIESTTYPVGIICRQSLDPYDYVERGTEIIYTISTGGPAPPPPSNPTPTPAAQEQPPADTTANLQETSAPNMKSGVLQISLWNVEPGTEMVYIVVLKKEGNNSAEEVFRSGVPVTSFPFSLPVTGTGPTDFYVYSIEDGVETNRYYSSLFND